jgi:hypothetical protein
MLFLPLTAPPRSDRCHESPPRRTRHTDRTVPGGPSGSPFPSPSLSAPLAAERSTARPRPSPIASSRATAAPSSRERTSSPARMSGSRRVASSSARSGATAPTRPPTGRPTGCTRGWPALRAARPGGAGGPARAAEAREADGNFLGAGVFGFLINPPIALCYRQGLNTTPVPAHTARCAGRSCRATASILIGVAAFACFMAGPVERLEREPTAASVREAPPEPVRVPAA